MITKGYRRDAGGLPEATCRSPHGLDAALPEASLKIPENSRSLPKGY